MRGAQSYKPATHIIAAARTCLNTDFVPQGRHAKAGLDCAGLVLHAYAQAGIKLHDRPNYPFPPPPHLLAEMLRNNHFIKMPPVSQPPPAAVLLFQFCGRAQHLAIAATDDNNIPTLIHAYAPAARVIETVFAAPWHTRLIGIYQHPSLLPSN